MATKIVVDVLSAFICVYLCINAVSICQAFPKEGDPGAVRNDLDGQETAPFGMTGVGTGEERHDTPDNTALHPPEGRTYIDAPPNEIVPVVDTHLRVDVPLVDTQLRENVPLVDTLARVEVPLVDSLARGDVPLVDTLARVEVPLVDPPAREDVPLVDPPAREDVPLVDSPARVDVPLVDSQARVDVPLVDTQAREDVPLVDTQAREDVPLVDTQARGDVPLVDTQAREDVPLVDTQARGNVPLEDTQPPFYKMLQGQQKLKPINITKVVAQYVYLQRIIDNNGFPRPSPASPDSVQIMGYILAVLSTMLVTVTVMLLCCNKKTELKMCCGGEQRFRTTKGYVQLV